MFSWDAIYKFLWGEKTIIADDTPGTGAILDARTQAERQTDIRFGELVATAQAVSWLLKASTAWRKFPVFNQSGCYACVAFTMAKLLGVMRWINDGIFVNFSAADIYDRRSNKGAAGDASEGMNGADPYAIAAQGVTLDAFVPSQYLTEAQINALQAPSYARDIAQFFKLQNPQPIVLPVGDIDVIASVIQATGKAVMVWYYFTAREWAIKNGLAGVYNIPQALDALYTPQDAAALRHSVSVVDFTLMPDGTKALVIEDSAWFGGLNRRLVTEQWHKARNIYAAYPMNFALAPSGNLVKYTFTKPLAFIPWSDAANKPMNPALNSSQLADVIALQTALQIMGYFPANVKPTGYYGALTARSVYAWQVDHLATIPRSTLDSLAGKSFGTASIKEMNAELAQ